MIAWVDSLERGTAIIAAEGDHISKQRELLGNLIF
jgi:hypothetical protein